MNIGFSCVKLPDEPIETVDVLNMYVISLHFPPRTDFVPPLFLQGLFSLIGSIILALTFDLFAVSCVEC